MQKKKKKIFISPLVTPKRETSVLLVKEKYQLLPSKERKKKTFLSVILDVISLIKKRANVIQYGFEIKCWLQVHING